MKTFPTLRSGPATDRPIGFESIFRTVLCLLVIVLHGGPIGATSSPEQSFFGLAHDVEGENFLYTEVHTRRTSDNGAVLLHTLYCDARGEILAERQVDYSSDAFAPAYRFQDQRDGLVEGLEWRDGRAVAFRHDPESRERREITLETTESLVADAGFDRLIVVSWDRLMADGTVESEFVVPSRFRTLGIRIKKLTEWTLGPDTVVTFRMTFRNPLLRLLVGPIDATYRQSDRSLARYEGLSNLRSTAGGPLEVRIDFPTVSMNDRIDPIEFPTTVQRCLTLAGVSVQPPQPRAKTPPPAAAATIHSALWRSTP